MLAHLFAGVGAISLASLIGVIFLSWKDRPSLMGSPVILAFATGTIIGTTFLHLIPESFATLPGLEAGGIMLASALFLFFLETWMGWDCNHRHHHHTEECDDHHHHPVKPLVWVNLVGDGVHNFIDGALLATVFMVDVNLGWMAVLAIALHEIPQELSDFLILRHGGLSVKRALLCNLLGASTAFAGAGVVVSFSGATGLVEHLFPVGAGCFLYLAMVDLLPEVKQMIEVRKEHWAIPFLSLTAGISLMGFMALDHSGHQHGETGHAAHQGCDHSTSEHDSDSDDLHLHHRHSDGSSHSHGLGELELPEDVLKSVKARTKEKILQEDHHNGHEHDNHSHEGHAH